MCSGSCLSCCWRRWEGRRWLRRTTAADRRRHQGRRVRARQPAASRVRLARRPVRRRGGPRRQRPVLPRRRGAGVHGRQRRRDRRSTAGAARSRIVEGLAPRSPTRRATNNADRARTASRCSADDRSFITNGGPTEPKDPATPAAPPTISRDDARRGEPGREPVRPRAAGSGATGGPLHDRRHLGVRARRQPGREPSATRRSTPTRSTCSSTAGGSSSPTRAATRSTLVRPFGPRLEPRRVPEPRRADPFGGPAVPMQAVPTSVVVGPDAATTSASSPASRSRSAARTSTASIRAPAP